MIDTVHAEIIKPHPSIQRWVESYIILSPAEVPVLSHPWTIMPDGFAYMIFHLFKDSSRLSVVGPRSVYTNVDRKDRTLTIIVKLKPGAIASILSFPAVDIQDASIPIRYVWPEKEEVLINALDRYAREKDYKTCISILDHVLIKKMHASRDVNRLILQATDLIDKHVGKCKIKSIADHLGITDRHLRELFKKHVGLTPKRYAKIARVTDVIKQVDNGSKEHWAQLALNSGYYDQPHLIDDFNMLLGESPEIFISRSNREEIL